MERFCGRFNFATPEVLQGEAASGKHVAHIRNHPVGPIYRPAIRLETPVRYEYPLLLDVSDRLIVIIGGGPVAARSARGDQGGSKARAGGSSFI